MKVFMDLKWFFKQEKRPYIVGILLLIVVAMLELVPPKIIGIIVDAYQRRDFNRKPASKMDDYFNGHRHFDVCHSLFLAGHDFRFRSISLLDSCGICCILILRKCRKPSIKRKSSGINGPCDE